LNIGQRKDVAQYDWRGFKDAHIEQDWLLIYKIKVDFVRFERTDRDVNLAYRNA
jgi:mRNA-degrading endonuclease YafQ of YafQ-DinJ toxin-antitoxin module